MDDGGIGCALFVCTGNTCRSPMAEGIFNALAAEKGLDARARSAGFRAASGMGAALSAIKAAGMYGADLTAHESRMLAEYDMDIADAVFCMESWQADAILNEYPRQRGKVWLLCEYALGKKRDIPDPFGADYGVYESCAREIYLCVREILRLG